MWIDRRESSDLTAEDLVQLRDLWADAFGDRFTPEDEQHALGGVHVIARNESGIVAQASAVPRAVRLGQNWLTVGYVEGVATRNSRQRSGLGTRVMEALHQELDARWPVGVLSTGRARAFYERLGWLPWRGPSYVVTARGEMRTPEEDAGLMVRTRAGAASVDSSQPIACWDRPGDAW